MPFDYNISDKSLELVKTAVSKAMGDITKSITQGTGLVAIDLQAPAKNLYPVNTPLRNKIPRVGGGTGTATQWRAVKNIVGSGFNAMGWVPEGQRSARMSYVTANVSASYATLGEEDQVSFEALAAGRTFEDLLATGTNRTLQKMMLKEENSILMGNAGSNASALGTTPTPTLSTSGAGATLPSATYSVICVALSGEGYVNSSLSATGVPTQSTFTGADGLTYTLNGGSAGKSTNATQAVTLGASLFASVAQVVGALGYAWYVGTAGSETLQAITTINSAVFSAPLLTGNQTAASVTAGDHSTNPNLGYIGLVYTAFASLAAGVGTGAAVIINQAAGVAGTGTPLTSSGRGSVVEIDNLLLQMWNQYQVSPTVIYVNAQELKNITTKCLTGTSGPLLQYFTSPEDGYSKLMAGGNIEFYFNPFAMNGGIKIPIMIHPTLPPGTIIGWCEDLPAQYKSDNVPQVCEVKTRRDYYFQQWPLRTRQYEFGVYSDQVLAVYAPFALGMITNIANG
jgi:hypothetical protein